jgi:hypothetical protein
VTPLITLVVACAVGQGCSVNQFGQMTCPAPASTQWSQASPYPMGGYYGGYGGYAQPAPAPRMAPAISEMFGDGSYVVPGSVRLVRSDPPASAPRAVARPAARPQAVAERRPYATPGPPLEMSEEEERQLLRESDRRSGPLVPRKAADVPQDASPTPERPPVGQLPTSASKDSVRLPSGNVAQLPRQPSEQVKGLAPGEGPSKVVTTDGKRLPNYAVSGMLWKPENKLGYQGSPHQESHALIESLQVPEAPLPDLIDDSGKLRVTVMSTNPEDRKQAIQDLRMGNGPLASFKDKILVRGTSPDNWDVKQVGLASETLSQGKPSVVMQEPSGKVIFATTKYTPEKAADALRKANPNFDPSKVPGLGSGKCPAGFTHEDWPAIIGIAVVAAVLMSAGKRPQPAGY